jgi:hypothetical protein
MEKIYLAFLNVCESVSQNDNGSLNLHGLASGAMIYDDAISARVYVAAGIGSVAV